MSWLPAMTRLATLATLTSDFRDYDKKTARATFGLSFFFATLVQRLSRLSPSDFRDFAERLWFSDFRTHARTRARTRAHAHTRPHTRTRARTRAHAHTRTCAHAHTRTHAHAQHAPAPGMCCAVALVTRCGASCGRFARHLVQFISRAAKRPRRAFKRASRRPQAPGLQRCTAYKARTASSSLKRRLQRKHAPQHAPNALKRPLQRLRGFAGAIYTPRRKTP